MSKTQCLVLSVAFSSCLASGLYAQDGGSGKTEPKADNDPAASLVILFDSGSSKVSHRDDAVLDRASRAFNEGKPLVMIISGSADRTGNPKSNLILSQRRASSVLNALVERGIPIDRFQVLAKGETEPSVPTPPGVESAANRRVVITWR